MKKKKENKVTMEMLEHDHMEMLEEASIISGTDATINIAVVVTPCNVRC
jgi:hypothetical protein